VKILHLYRETNEVADTMAKLSVNQEWGIKTFVNVLLEIPDILIKDSQGVATPRLIAI